MIGEKDGTNLDLKKIHVKIRKDGYSYSVNTRVVKLSQFIILILKFYNEPDRV